MNMLITIGCVGADPIIREGASGSETDKQKEKTSGSPKTDKEKPYGGGGRVFRKACPL